MKSRLRIIYGTSPREIAEHGDGYEPNGESLFSRRVAHPDPTPRLRSRIVGRFHGRHTTAELIRETEGELARLRCELRIENEPVRCRKIAKSIEIKTQFLERLRQDGEHHDQ